MKVLSVRLESCLLALYAGAAHAAKRHPSAISSMEELWRFFVTVFALLVLPVLLYSLWSFAKDPAARELPPLAAQWVKRKLCGFLSSPQQRSTAASATTEDRAAKPKAQ